MGKNFYKIGMAVLLACTALEGNAQRFFSVVFDQLPRNFQLYARNESNEAAIPISGGIELAGWSHMSVVTFRNGQRISYQRSGIQYATGSAKGTFSMAPQIKAELAEYSFEVYANKNATDSVLIVRRDDVVAGDFYVINGQSNALAVGGSNFSSEYCRTIGRIPDNSPAYSPADTLWIRSGYSFPNVGIWGIELQKMIMEKYGIPTCVLNGSIPGTRISEHLLSQPNTPATIYDLLRQRITLSGAQRIRAFFWLQGEDDALSGPDGFDGYDQKFDQLHRMWQRDYPMVENFVVMQINILFNRYYKAGALRDFQRRTGELYPKTLNFATVGLPYYDGVHYEREGYLALAKQLFGFISPLFYGTPEDPNRKSPTIRKVFYTSPDKKAITLVFDEGQKMMWPQDTLVADRNGVMKKLGGSSWFFLDGNEAQAAPIASYEVQDNRIELKLTSAVTARTLNYLPAYTNVDVFPIFPGPFLKNKNGLTAFSFHEAAIADPLAIAGFKSEPQATGGGTTVGLSWQPVAADGIKYQLERKKTGEGNFSKVAQYDEKSVSFVDKGVEPNTSYTYRVKAVGTTSESPFVELEVRTETILTLFPPQVLSWTAFPNPTRNFVVVRFEAPVSGRLSLFDLNGILRLSSDLTQTVETTLSLASLAPGKYILVFHNGQGERSSAQLVVE
ncbi:T9SS type A sorting domain-containing protein [Salmonirosea aquatica]|uniref:T9SS type A sorting domain-containing protein n=1 Tax=Salmonirosea aquatica TaxID=2654236 RepID=A0A7C9F3T0_9BACT|nr:T9SS type A sorting domain-containing protein [Cytophagaceae bacterium SJW1-29]